MAVEHYENFPVASWLCPPGIRQAVVAIYHFARVADDIADEGFDAASIRFERLHRYRATLHDALSGREFQCPYEWRAVFSALSRTHQQHQLPTHLLHDLLDAFEQDIRNPAYDSREQLLDYCVRSANPIGRLLLHLQGVRDPELEKLSDRICTALQLINFWQDLSVDIPRARIYIPRIDAQAHGLTWPCHPIQATDERHQALVAELCAWAGNLMEEGSALPLRIGGRMGMELRFVVQGGLRILEKIAQMKHATFHRRPVLRAADLPVLTWRALRMSTPGN